MNIGNKLCVPSLQRICLNFLLTHAAGRPIKAMRIAEIFEEELEELYHRLRALCSTAQAVGRSRSSPHSEMRCCSSSKSGKVHFPSSFVHVLPRLIVGRRVVLRPHGTNPEPQKPGSA